MKIFGLVCLAAACIATAGTPAFGATYVLTVAGLGGESVTAGDVGFRLAIAVEEPAMTARPPDRCLCRKLRNMTVLRRLESSGILDAVPT